MNPYCECPVSGFCKRHQKIKGPEQHKRCQGTAQTQDCGLQYWNAWEQGRAGATAPPDPKPNPEGFCHKEPKPRKAQPQYPCATCGPPSLAKKMKDRATNLAAAAVDFVKDGMHVSTKQQQEHRLEICNRCPVFANDWCNQDFGGCGCNLSLKVKARAAYCPQGKWFAYGDNYRPLIDPTRSLIFHLYPKRGAEWNWRWHLDQIRKYQTVFNGRIVIGVGLDKHTHTIDEVRQVATGINVTDWVVAENTVALAETHTHVKILELVKTDDPNAIVFRYHAKGVTKTPDAVEQKWARLLWEANMDLPSVEDALASHLTCGAMRSLKPLVQRKPGDFFYAGSAYWFRSREAFERDWTHTDKTRWWVEYFPCHLFNRQESACLLYDLTESSVIREEYFSRHIQPEWDQWRAARYQSM